MSDVAGQWERSAGEWLERTARTIGPPLLFGFRLWVSVCLALYVAFWLQLDNPSWAGTSAALVCQPRLGASLRKGWFRMIGTLVGGVAVVALTACFPQNRIGFLGGLAAWGGVCALVSTLLSNFAAYGAALAGYTAAIIASDELGAVGGPNGEAFTLAITRISEIWIGIVSAGIVLAGTDFGAAPRRLAGLFASLSAEMAARFGSTLKQMRIVFAENQSLRRELTRRVIALDPVIDDAIGESSRLRYHSPVLQSAVDGLFQAIASWRTTALRLEQAPDRTRRQAEAVLLHLPEELQSTAPNLDPEQWLTDPIGMRRRYDAAIRKLIAMPTDEPSLRLLADEAAKALGGLSRALNGVALLIDEPNRPNRRRPPRRLHVPDWAPAFVNAGRAAVVIGAIEIFWIISAWPGGAGAITWASIVVILFAPRADQAYAGTVAFTIGTGLAALCAAIILFAVLPNFRTFVGFSLVIGAYLVPMGAMMAQPWQASVFMPMTANFLPLVAPTNQMSYNTVQFYNGALAIAVGSCAAALSFRLLPPLPPALRAKRLLALTLRDLRRLATDPRRQRRDLWEGLTYSRLSALPNEAEPLQRSELVAALSTGVQIVQLRRIALRLGLTLPLDEALLAFAQGDSATATARLVELDRDLAALTRLDAQISAFVMRARGRILALCDTLTQHQAYFDGGRAG